MHRHLYNKKYEDRSKMISITAISRTKVTCKDSSLAKSRCINEMNALLCWEYAICIHIRISCLNTYLYHLV